MAKYEKREKAIDLSHHLSDLSRAREVSPLKGLARYFGKPGVISLSGGMPSADYFPYDNVSANILAPDSFALDSNSSSVSWFWRLFGSSTKTQPITVPKYPTKPDQVNLATSLQYGTSKGLPQLVDFIKEFVEDVFQPAYSDATVLLQTGNTDAWSRTVLTLCNRGEMFLTEEWTYPSAIASSHPYGISPASVKMDGEGMRSDDLRQVLASWNEEERGAKRPHLLYTVPIGQNPSGATMGLQRKKEIYDICVEYDIIIVEDDPYYFLQEGPYHLKFEREARSSSTTDTESFFANLAPSYLRIDYQGRVIRLDTFSKTIAPGSRLGWFTCSPLIAERFERHGETTAQAPCGFGQALITQLLITWGQKNWARWLHGLAVEYTHRRNFLIDSLAEEFHIRKSIGTQDVWNGLEVYDAYLKPIQNTSGDISEKFDIGTKMFSFVPPTSGMFVWIQLHFDNFPSLKDDDDDKTYEMKLWEALAEEGLLIAPGWFFSAHVDQAPPKKVGNFRIAFSFGDEETMKKSTAIIGKVFREFFKDH
ncbi:Class-I pyridoxal-phosphate-dependent aminotransferase-like protein [Abortiporus biennis]